MTGEPKMVTMKEFFCLHPHDSRSPKLSDDEEAKKLQPLMPNLPIVYWQQNKKKKVPKNSTGCTKFPDIYDIHFNNKYWQVLESSNGSFYLYGAYLDVRANNRLGPTVRVLGMINRLEPSVKTQCQLWFSEDKPGSEPVVSRVLEYKYIWDKQWGNYKQGRECKGGRQSCQPSSRYFAIKEKI